MEALSTKAALEAAGSLPDVEYPMKYNLCFQSAVTASLTYLVFFPEENLRMKLTVRQATLLSNWTINFFFFC